MLLSLNLPSLKGLTLRHCTMSQTHEQRLDLGISLPDYGKGFPAKTVRQKQGNASILGLQIQKLYFADCNSHLISTLLKTVDPKTLSYLTCAHVLGYAFFDVLGERLTRALRELVIIGNCPAISDADFLKLLNHPSIKILTVPNLDLKNDYWNHPCKWTRLTINHNTISIFELAALPSAVLGFNTCIVEGGLYNIRE